MMNIESVSSAQLSAVSAAPTTMASPSSSATRPGTGLPGEDSHVRLTQF
jgi:hypothetical protein